MYPFILSLHNLIRWIVLIAGVVAIVLAFSGWFGKREWSKVDNRAGVIYVASIDVNVVLGLILYLFLSPITRQALADLGAAMSNADLRYFAVEHIFGIIAALVLVHVGRATSKRATETIRKHRAAAIWYTLSFLVILLMIPWDRLLLRGLG